MANVKISELPQATTIAGSEELPIVQGNETKKTTINELNSGLVPKTRTIAGVDLQDNVTKAELQTALEFGTKQNVIDGSNKLSADYVTDTNTTNKFVTAEEKTRWDNKSDFSGDYDDLNDKPDLSVYEEKTDADAMHELILDQIPQATTEMTDFIHIEDSSNLPTKSKTLGGNATQETTSISGGDEYDSPSPDHPQDIHVVTGDNTLKVTGKNLITFNNISASTGANINYTPNNSEITFNGTSLGSGTLISLTPLNIILPPGTYNLAYYYKSGTYTAGNNQTSITLKDENGNNLVQKYMSAIGTGSTNASFTLTKSTPLSFQIYCGGGNHKFENYTIQAQINIGSTATTYEPYQAQTQTIHLGSIELAKIGDYQDKIFKAIEGDSVYDSLDSTTKASLSRGSWYKQGNIGKATFIGSDNENWQINGADAYITIRGALGLNSISLSNYFKSITTTTNTYGDIKFGNNNSNLIFFKALEEHTDINGWKTWLSTHNTTAYYILATPTYTEITDTDLITALETWYNATTYKNITNSWTEPSGTNAQALQQWVYRKDLETMFSNLTNAILSNT